LNIVPLYGRLFSQAVPDHRSENVEIREAIGVVSEGVRNRGIWVMDRGGDKAYLYNYLMASELRFLLRVRGDQGLRSAQGIEPVVDLARGCPMLFDETVVKEEAGHERLLHLECGRRKVRLPDRREELTLVVVKGFGEEPLMIPFSSLPIA